VGLIEILSGVESVSAWVSGARVLEVGCGTSMPSAYLLQSILSSPSPVSTKTVLHLQDYNKLVLSLVSLPNLILATLPFLPPSAFVAPTTTTGEVEEEEREESLVPELDQPGNIAMTPTLIAAFKTLLDEKNIELRFTYGDWSGLSRDIEKYDLVLTAETIYAESSVTPLLDVLRNAYELRSPDVENGTEKGLEESIGDLRVQDEWSRTPLQEGKETVVLVAAKVLYFGVGGGIQSFLAKVEESGGWSSTVKEWTKGVGRRILRIGWDGERA
ncbi:hypothetical protein P7C73_g1313, partial [Tremellales sp. Uapishka_1]